MGGKTVAAPHAVASQAGLVPGWPRSRPRLFLVAGGDLASTSAWVPRIAELGCRLSGASLTVTQQAPDFATFGGVRALVDAMTTAGGAEARALVAEHRETFDALEGQAGADQVRASRMAETITFAVTRRISRESHHSALLIDRLVDCLLDLLRRCPAYASGLTVVLPDLARWDRPSLRTLCRLAKRLAPEDRFAVVAFGSTPEEAPRPGSDDAGGRITWAHARFLRRLLAEPEVVTLPLGTDRPEERPLPDPADDFSLTLLDVGNALAFQNYERVYLLCHTLLRRDGEPEREAQVRRLVGIANAQLGDFAAAERELQLASDTSRSPEFRAHLQYLIGLLQTKRVYDLDEADRRYAAGLAILAERGELTDQGRIERAWLLNGQALVLAMRAKQAHPGERDRLLRAAFDLELEAHRLCRDQAGPAASYLRHNLLANLTFLLEISRRYPEAIDFWKRSLDRYLAANSQGFNAAFESRLGMLLFKAGRPAEALATLERVRELCRATRDRFYEERCHLAIAHVLHGSGRPADALEVFQQGAAFAAGLRTWDAYADHVTGILGCLATLPDRAGFERALAEAAGMEPTAPLADAIRGTPADAEPLERMAQAGVRQPIPSPKMPAYIPSVDLEGAPARDLNRYLVSEGGPLD